MARKTEQRPPWALKLVDNGDANSLIEMVRENANRALRLATTPISWAVSKPAQKFYLTSFFFFTASLVLLSISSVAYSIFYYNYIPQISLDEVIHLQFGDETYPFGITSLQPQVLMTKQAYDVSITLNLPRTPSNVAAGNFMLDLQLCTSAEKPSSIPSSQQIMSLLSQKDSTVVAHSRRPAILPQPTHPLLSAFDTLVFRLPWSVLTYPFRPTSILTLESEELSIPMFESLVFQNSAGNTAVPSHARLELKTLKHVSTLQVYTAKIHFHAKFTGLKYLVYNYRIISFLLFTSIFYTVSISTMAIAWLSISMIFWIRSDGASHSHTPPSSKPSKQEQRQESPRLKIEEEEDQNQSSSSLLLHSTKHEPPLSEIKRESPSEAITRTTQIEPLQPVTTTASEDIDLDLDLDNDYSDDDIDRIKSEIKEDEDEDEHEHDQAFDSGLGTSIAGGGGSGGGAVSSAIEWQSSDATSSSARGRERYKGGPPGTT